MKVALITKNIELVTANYSMFLKLCVYVLFPFSLKYLPSEVWHALYNTVGSIITTL